MSLPTTVLGQMSEIRELHATDRRRQVVISEMLKADQRSAEIRELRTDDHTRQQQLIQTLTMMQSLQGQVTTLQGQKIAPKQTTRLTPVTTTPAPTATTTTSVTNAQLRAMIDQSVTATLAVRDANRNGDDSQTSGTSGRRTKRIVRECTYQDFIKCKPLYFKGTKGVVELTQWFERMETVFRISNCPVENQVKFSTCTLLAGALTWWNSHVMTVSHDAAYAMTWADLRKKMTDKYCPRNEMKKLEAELWNLKVKEQKKFETLPKQSKPPTEQETRTLAGPIPVVTVKKKPYGDLNPFAQNATVPRRPMCTKIHKCNKLGHLLVDLLGVREMPIMLTIRGAMGQARNLLASSVKFKDTSRGNAQS
ncbi:reverse transcriptase domain-containing protein [Tanacetum coccineum]|uniref:Reverse transcriptase domain-containing protein n=1 Tax=Tanacetum coccineum TaxID=301880 RepID=A0ABQ5BHK4_9ASTR